VRVDDQNTSAIVDPGGMDVRVTGSIQQWLDRVRHGVMAEMSKDELAADIETWNRSHTQQLRPP
jgi:hypothetical protein